VIQIEYDPSVVSYAKLLDLFWKDHDPTTLNRQGADDDTEYRSIILTHSQEQRAIVEASKKAAAAELIADWADWAENAKRMLF
jgi:peptide-methionine (S)-S-oxide reductase